MPGLLDVSCVVAWHSETLTGYFGSTHLHREAILYFSKDTAMLRTLIGSLYALPITWIYSESKYLHASLISRLNLSTTSATVMFAYNILCTY